MGQVMMVWLWHVRHAEIVAVSRAEFHLGVEVEHCHENDGVLP